MYRFVASLAISFSSFVFLAGCSDDTKNGKPVSNESGAKTQADEHHDHGHGPKGGYAFEFSLAGINGEWFPRYNDNLIIFYIYGDDKKTEQPASITKMMANRKVGDKVEEFEIKPTNAQDGKASRFEIVDEAFALALKSTGANLEIEIDGKKHSIALKKDAHH
jgi:hypothetical protein